MKQTKISPHHSAQYGFSLLELTIVLGIVGLIAIGSLLSFSEQKVNAEWLGSKAKLNLVKTALLDFADENKFLPCPDVNGLGYESRQTEKGKIPAIPAIPATPAIPKTDTAPTIPAVPATPAQPAIPNIDVSVCTTASGTVPYEMLGLSAADVEDAWGNPFVYAIDAGATQADDLLDCPTDSACFFNRDPIPDLPPSKVYPGKALPAFDNSTLPVKGQLGANNLMLCAASDCADIVAEGLVVVLLSQNENGNSHLGLIADEAENADNDAVFVEKNYSKSPFFDDSVVTISGQELKKPQRFEASVTYVSVTGDSNTVLTGNDLKNMGDNTVGGIGTNVGTDAAQSDSISQVFDFGADAANKEIVVSFKTHAKGSWDQPSSPRDSVTSDQASVAINGTEKVQYAYDYTDNSQQGYEQTSYVSPKSGWVPVMDASGNESWQYVSSGDTVTTYVDYWNTSENFIVTADENGKVEINFTVATTANYEVIDFTDIELKLYNSPPLLPSMPSVDPISGISQTQGLQ
ncbi:type II secretion system protein [Thiomicrorhabdus sediminis]|uniref:Prepilin-type N-terminal cleavage/methylation domain-containing protein n=1 Tax=Thiomicrorhabdus sediminis TaxID=2580412 RepID=A0A4P9K6R5_9GAMM|nr:prepilin-type N-terminal cleavage/methylation domain-containing protein [Thiomicrorhabdus sediminis]QCU90784.1 prepilin-type N-terminal cleavage/methylation domain-containing protein [Thiomicrorhabdus sediminis]